MNKILCLENRSHMMPDPSPLHPFPRSRKNLKAPVIPMLWVFEKTIKSKVTKLRKFPKFEIPKPKRRTLALFRFFKRLNLKLNQIFCFVIKLFKFFVAVCF